MAPRNVMGITYECGVYLIQTSCGSKYVGGSNCIAKRWSHHKAVLKAGKHKNKRLQAIYDKNGIEAISISVLETCLESSLREAEQDHIDRLKPDLNFHDDVSGKGHKWSVEAREKFSADCKARHAANPDIGAKISSTKKGISRDPAVVAKIAEANRGRKLTEEHKAKIGAAGIGRSPSAETRAKLAKAASNLSEETLRRRSEGLKRAWERRKNEQKT